MWKWASKYCHEVKEKKVKWSEWRKPELLVLATAPNVFHDFSSYSFLWTYSDLNPIRPVPLRVYTAAILPRKPLAARLILPYGLLQQGKISTTDFYVMLHLWRVPRAKLLVSCIALLILFVHWLSQMTAIATDRPKSYR